MTMTMMMVMMVLVSDQQVGGGERRRSRSEARSRNMGSSQRQGKHITASGLVKLTRQTYATDQIFEFTMATWQNILNQR